MTRALRRRPTGDAGVTIVELLIGITISTVIMGCLVQALVSVTRTAPDVTARAQGAADVALASRFFADDVASASSSGVSTTVPAACQGSITTGLVSLTGSDPATTALGAAGSHTVSWGLDAAGAVHRVSCRAGATSDVTVMRGVSGPPTVSCTTSCSSATQVRLQVTEAQSRLGSTATTATLLGTTRAWSGRAQTAPPTGTAPLLALGGRGVDVSSGGNGTLTVNGPILVDGTSNPAVDGGSKNGISATGGVYTAGGTCTNLAPGTTCSTAGSAVADPYASLPDPQTTNSASATPLPVTTVNNWTINSKSTTTIASGIYLITGGMSIGGQADVRSSGPVLLYFVSGSLSVAGGANVSLTGLASASAPYGGFLVYQPRSNTTAMSLSGGSGTQSYNGLVYLPGAQLQLSGGGGLSLANVIADSVSVQGNGGATVG